MDKEIVEMNKEIDKNYSNLRLPVIEPKYKDGEITNEKEIQEKIKLFIGILTTLWLYNLSIMNETSKKVQVITYSQVVSRIAQKGLKMTISKNEWEKIINQAMKDRAKQVKIKQVIKGNARALNKRLQKTVVNGYKNGKSKVQIAKELQKELGYNNRKAKQIATTEVNYYKSEAQLNAIKGVDGDVKKTWIHNKSKDPRETHVRADGQIADKKGYFTVGGKRTQAPQHFGIASEDIYCRCTMRIDPA